MKIDYAQELLDPRGRNIKCPDPDKEEQIKNATVGDLLWLVLSNASAKDDNKDNKKRQFTLTQKVVNEEDLTVSDVSFIQNHIWNVISCPITAGVLDQYLENIAE